MRGPRDRVRTRAWLLVLVPVAVWGMGCERQAGDEDSSTKPADCTTLTGYTDADGDGWGDATGETRTDCERPGTDWVLTPGDCDDARAARAPGNTESCNEHDDDCDVLIDNDDDDDSLDLGTATDWYTDSDGFGAGTPTTSCTAPSDTVADNTDCDDESSVVSPAATEVCNGIDDDCDTDIDIDDDSSLDLGSATTFYADDDGDGFGGSGQRQLRRHRRHGAGRQRGRHR